jgi:hypothetical protein
MRLPARRRQEMTNAAAAAAAAPSRNTAPAMPPVTAGETPPSASAAASGGSAACAEGSRVKEAVAVGARLPLALALAVAAAVPLGVCVAVAEGGAPRESVAEGVAEVLGASEALQLFEAVIDGEAPGERLSVAAAVPLRELLAVSGAVALALVALGVCVATADGESVGAAVGLQEGEAVAAAVALALEPGDRLSVTGGVPLAVPDGVPVPVCVVEKDAETVAEGVRLAVGVCEAVHEALLVGDDVSERVGLTHGTAAVASAAMAAAGSAPLYIRRSSSVASRAVPPKSCCEPARGEPLYPIHTRDGAGVRSGANPAREATSEPLR